MGMVVYRDDAATIRRGPADPPLGAAPVDRPIPMLSCDHPIYLISLEVALVSALVGVHRPNESFDS